MAKSADAFRTISEVSELLDTPAHVLRFWESKFPQIKPVKRAGGRRYYRPSDLALLAGIKVLLHDQGHAIKDVQKTLRTHGVRHVSQLSPLDLNEKKTAQKIDNTELFTVHEASKSGDVLPFARRAPVDGETPDLFALLNDVDGPVSTSKAPSEHDTSNHGAREERSAELHPQDIQKAKAETAGAAPVPEIQAAKTPDLPALPDPAAFEVSKPGLYARSLALRQLPTPTWKALTPVLARLAAQAEKPGLR